MTMDFFQVLVGTLERNADTKSLVGIEKHLELQTQTLVYSEPGKLYVCEIIPNDV